VATGAGHIRTGSGCRSERVAKFNQFQIEEQLDGGAQVQIGMRLRIGPFVAGRRTPSPRHLTVVKIVDVRTSESTQIPQITTGALVGPKADIANK
jgi:hypothetical protein